MNTYQLSLPGPSECDPEVLQELYRPNLPHYGALWLETYHAIIERLQAEGCSNLYSPTVDDCNLLDTDDVQRVLKDYKPEIVIHLAAVVGGIVANMQHPAEYFYQNVMMGVPFIHKSYE